MSANVRPYCQLEELVRKRLEASVATLPAARRILQQQAGQHRSRFRGRGMEFSEVRIYQPGDDVRSIDWRVTARREKPHTKLFQEERERPVFIICDQSVSQFFGSRHCFKSVATADIAALIAWIALDQGDRVGGIVFSDHAHHEIKPVRSRKGVMQFLHLISGFNQALSVQDTGTPQTDLNSVLLEARQLVRPGSLMFVISDFLDTTDQTYSHLFTLARHNDVVAMRVRDPLEQELPPPGYYPVSDGEQVIMLNTRSRRIREQYHADRQQRDDQLDSACNRANVHLLDHSTHDSPLETIRRVKAIGRRA